MTCKDCYHYEACKEKFAGLRHIRVDEPKKHLELNPQAETVCQQFRDKTKIVEIPDVERGQEVYFVFDKVDGKYRVRKGRIYQFVPMQVKIATEFINFDLTLRLGESAFLTKEEAEARAKELNEK